MKKRRNRKHFEATRDLWEWLAKKGADDKCMWPRYAEVADLSCSCAFCEYFYATGFCTECPLGEQLGVCGFREESAYDMWSSGSKEERKIYAHKIYEFTDRYIKKTFKEKKK
jgi:hypothetical protein